MIKKNLTIVLADDDEEDSELIGDAILTVKPDVKLQILSTGKAVMDYLEKQEDNQLPCLVILDYNMPELNGSEVLNLISKAERYKTIPKLILSTSSAPLHMHECISNGATEYFVKPNNLAGLMALARKMLSFCQPD